MALAESHGVEMPIASDVYRVLNGDTNARGVYRGLLRVSAGAESEPG
jgi:glycerol-3-phosphate dehydrogenase (NAD(P)+)